MKKPILSLALIGALTTAALGGEIDHPPLQPECDPTTQTCPAPCNSALYECPDGGTTQSITGDSSSLTDVAVTLLTLTLSVLP